MKKSALPLLVLVALSAVPTMDAALRARYINVDALVGTKPWGDEHNRTSLYMDYGVTEMIPGIWDGWSDETGFDEVIDTRGELTEATQVQATYWVDSIGEPRRNSGCVLFSQWAQRESFLDPDQLTPGGNGEAVFLAGGIRIGESGPRTYEYICKGGFVIWVDLNRDGVIEIKSEEEIVLGGRRPEGDGLSWSKTDEDTFESFTVDYPEAGLYKILVYYYHYSQVNYAVLRENGTIVPAAVFGKIKGLPGVTFTSGALDGDPISADQGFVTMETGEVLGFEAEAMGNITPEDAEFLWDFDGDGNTDTTTVVGVVEWHCTTAPKGGLAVPSVRVRRKSDNITSKSASFWSVLMIKEGTHVVRGKLSPRLQHGTSSRHQVFDLSGRCIGDLPVPGIWSVGMRVMRSVETKQKTGIILHIR